MDSIKLAQDIVRSCLQLDPSVNLTPNTYLMGNFPEFNSLTITTMILEIEETLDCEVSDDEISAEIFESIESLANFIQSKMDGR